MTTRISNILVVVCFICAILCLVLASCTQPINPSQPSTPSAPSISTQERVRTINTDFALSYLKELSATEGQKNIFVSPFSLMQALTMTWNGANGSTRTAMANTLRLTGLTEQDANAGLKNLSELFRTLDNRVEFRSANGIWYNTRLAPEQAFITTVRDAFGAEVRGKAFGTEDVRGDINRWVEQQTNNRIKDLIQRDFTRLDLMCLVNAVYFNGAWQLRFDSTMTGEGDFFREDGSKRRAMLMSTGRERQLRNGSLPNARLVELPYGDGRFVMTAILPNHGTRVRDVLASLTPATWNDAVSKMSSSGTVVVMPKFSMQMRTQETGKEPRELHKMGMGAAFSDTADFSKMYRPPTEAKISFVIHQTFLQVNERGTEAAGATAVGIVERVSISTPFVARFDKPFAFMIRERETGTILFAGALYEP
jgi:serpin B